MTWITPKTDWTTDDAIGTADLNRIEGNTEALRVADVSLDSRLDVIEAKNIRSGVVTLQSSYPYEGKGVIADSNITANTRIICTVQSLSGAGIVVAQTFTVDSRNVGVNMVIKSSSTADRSTVGYILIEP